MDKLWFMVLTRPNSGMLPFSTLAKIMELCIYFHLPQAIWRVQHGFLYWKLGSRARRSLNPDTGPISLSFEKNVVHCTTFWQLSYIWFWLIERLSNIFETELGSSLFKETMFRLEHYVSVCKYIYLILSTILRRPTFPSMPSAGLTTFLSLQFHVQNVNVNFLLVFVMRLFRTWCFMLVVFFVLVL